MCQKVVRKRVLWMLGGGEREEVQEVWGRGGGGGRVFLRASAHLREMVVCERERDEMVVCVCVCV